MSDTARRGAAPTLDEVARAAGVSRATASRAINGAANVSAETRAAVARAVSDLGYVPNRAARSLVRRRADAVAVVVAEPDARLFSDPFFARILRGVSGVLGRTDIQMSLLVRPAGEDGGRLLRYLAAGHSDAAIVVSHHRDDGLAAYLAEAPLPSVFVGRPYDHAERLSYVDSDNVGGGALAARHLVARGARRIGTVSGPLDMAAAVDRLAGWRRVLVGSGLADDAVAPGDFTAAGGEAALDRLLREHPDLDGVFVASDLMASGALGVAADHGRRVPDDLLVVGYDDSDIARHTRPPLTSVTNPAEDLGRRAADLVLRHLSEGTRREEVVVPSALVVRESA